MCSQPDGARLLTSIVINLGDSTISAGQDAVRTRLCTIAAQNYLATATLLARSFARHHPDIPVSVLIVDGDTHDLGPECEFDVVLPSDLAIAPEDFGRMATYYDVTELSTALKPYLLEALLDEGADAVMYLDPDIEVFARLDDLFAAAIEHGIALTPHVLQPIPRDGLLINEEALLLAGQFNLGFIAVGRSAKPFLRYWTERTRLFAIIDPEHGYFTDQRWVDAVPSLFDHFIVKDRGCNVAYWNLHERELALDREDAFTVDGVPVRFFHYSGHDHREPFRLSKHLLDLPRVRVDQSAPLRRLLLERSRRMEAASTAIGKGPPYGYRRGIDGALLTPWIRRAYWHGVNQAELTGAAPPPHAFAAGDFVGWLCEPASPSSPVPRHLAAYWETRADLMRSFPDPLGSDGPGLMRWASADEPYAQAALAALRELPSEGTGKGVNLIGYHAGQFGVGEAGRLVARMVRAAGVPTAVTTLYPPEQTHAAHRRTSVAGAPYDFNILSINADGLRGFAGSPEYAACRGPRVGVWYWEVGVLPQSMRPAFDLVDEVWCASDHVRSLLTAVSDRPVVKHPLVIDVPTSPTALQRSDLGLPEVQFLFGFVFDYSSVLKRKNPLGLIDAYCSAFGPADGAALVLKTLNAWQHPLVASAVHHAADERPDIIVLDDHLPAIEMRALFQLLDCYVSLHRAEGLGLTMAAAMAAGTPCVATGWSGNLEFMTNENSMLVPYEMVEVGDEAEPYSPDACWAEPDLAAASAAMRALFDDRALAAALGQRGRASIAADHHASIAAAWFLERFASLTTTVAA